MTSGAERLAVGIVGFGKMGRLRREVLDAHPRLVTVAVADGDPAALAGVTGVRTHATHEALLDEALDALVVCVPARWAAQITAAGLERGLHVFCEKPPARTSEEVAWVRSVEARHPGARLAYGFNHRRHGSAKRARAIVESGELGRVIAASAVYGKPRLVADGASWRAAPDVAGGGILLDQGIHAVDLLRWLVGDADTVHALVEPHPDHPALDGNVFALWRTPDGALASLHSSATMSPPRFALDVTLERGSLRLRGILSVSRAYEPEGLEVLRGSGPSATATERSVYDRDDSWQEEIAEFAASILEGREPAHGGSLEAYRTMYLVDRIYAADPKWATRATP